VFKKQNTCGIECTKETEDKNSTVSRWNIEQKKMKESSKRKDKRIVEKGIHKPMPDQ
jgi:hypothetical protein